MKSLNYLTIILLLLLSGASFAQDYPPARFEHAMAAIGDHIYVFGGLVATDGKPGQAGMDGDYYPQNDLWIFNKQTGVWESITGNATMPLPCYGHVAGATDGKLYTFGGRTEDNDNNSGATWCFDPATGQWSEMNPGGNPPPYTAYSSAAILDAYWNPAGGTLFVYGGFSNYNNGGQQVSQTVNTLHEYYPFDSNWWTRHTQALLAQGVSWGSMVSVFENLFIFGGLTDEGSFTNNLSKYDPFQDKLTHLTPSNPAPESWPGPRYKQQMNVVNDQIVLTGGKGENGVYKDHWVYDVTSSVWSKQPDIPDEVHLQDAKSVADASGTIYYFGGSQANEPLDNFYKLQETEWFKFDKKKAKFVKVGAEVVTLNMSVSPPEALDQGCAVDPGVGDHEYEPGQEAVLTATDNPEGAWYFREWTGVPGGSSKATTVTMDEDKNAIAHFREVKLLASGSSKESFCVCDISTKSISVIEGSLTAYGDDWTVTAFTISDDAKLYNLQSVYLEKISILYNQQTVWQGTYTGATYSVLAQLNSPIVIPEGETISFTVQYHFKELTGESIRDDEMELIVQTIPHGKPEHFENGLITGQSKGRHQIGNVFILNKLPYMIIENAVKKAKNDDVLMICKGRYETHIETGKNLSYLGIDPDSPPEIHARTENTPVFLIQEGFLQDLHIIGIPSPLGSGITQEFAGNGVVELSRVSIKNCTNGVVIHDGKIIMTDCQISDCDFGLKSKSAGDDITMIRTEIKNCNSAGVQVRGGGRLQGVQLQISQAYFGMWITNSELDLEYSHIFDCRVGVDLSGMTKFNIRSNTIESCSLWGLYCSNTKGHSSGLIVSNQLIGNCTGISVTDSPENQIQIRNNTIKDSKCSKTGIRLSGSSPVIRGNHLINNNGAAVFGEERSNPLVSGNNLSGNSVGVENKDPAVMIEAGHNYWGQPGGPASGDLVGNIQAADWLTEPVDLVSSFKSDTLFLLPDQSDSVAVYHACLLSEEDDVIIEWTDEMGWIRGDQRVTLTVTREGVVQWIPIRVAEAGAPPNALSVTTRSLADPARFTEEKTVLMSYEPELSRLMITPDSLMLVAGDTIPLTPLGFDQYDQAFTGQWVWSATGASIDQAGLLVCDINETPVAVTLEERISGMTTTSHYYVTEEEELVQSLMLHPDLDSLAPGMKTMVSYQAWNQFGFTMETELLWSCDAGSINSRGLFTAGETTGWVTITASDAETGVVASCQVKVVATMGISHPAEPDDLVVYPNPASGVITIDHLPASQSGTEIRLYNMYGALCLMEKVAVSGPTSCTLDINMLPAGMYLLEVRNSLFSSVQSLIIE